LLSKACKTGLIYPCYTNSVLMGPDTIIPFVTLAFPVCHALLMGPDTIIPFVTLAFPVSHARTSRHTPFPDCA
jgi:hypothetical protein